MKAMFWHTAFNKLATSRWYHFAAALALGHFFIALGREDFGWSYMFRWQYWLDLPGIAWVAWSTWFVLVWWVAMLKPSKSGWRVHIFQLLGTYLAVVVWFLLQLSLVLLFSWRQTLWEGSFLINEGPVAGLLLAAMLVYELRKNVKTEVETTIQGPNAPLLLEGRMGSEVVLVNPAQLLFVELVGEHCIAYLTNQRQLRLSASMSTLEAQLPSALFFRTNRQFLVHKQACGTYRTERSGRLQLNVLGRAEAVAVSQHKGAAFRAWLKAT